MKINQNKTALNYVRQNKKREWVDENEEMLRVVGQVLDSNLLGIVNSHTSFFDQIRTQVWA